MIAKFNAKAIRAAVPREPRGSDVGPPGSPRRERDDSPERRSAYFACGALLSETLVGDDGLVEMGKKTEAWALQTTTELREREQKVAALEAGAADFVTKPLNIPLVRARVKTQLLVKKQADELQRLVAQDSLTGISNRRAFEEKLAAEWSRHQRQGEALALALVALAKVLLAVGIVAFLASLIGGEVGL